jgi:hypothetical protein
MFIIGQHSLYLAMILAVPLAMAYTPGALHAESPLMSFERFTKVRFYIFPDFSNFGCLPGTARGLPSLLIHGDYG